MTTAAKMCTGAATDVTSRTAKIGVTMGGKDGQRGWVRMNKWSEEETNILRNNYNKVANDDLMALLPEKSWLAIYKKARRLGLKKTPENEWLNRSLARRGEKCCNWKGGKKINKKGYVLILKPEHHRADKNGYVLEHIVVWEENNNKEIDKGQCIHHINGKKDDNRTENLQLMSIGEHSAFHNRKRGAHK